MSNNVIRKSVGRRGASDDADRRRIQRALAANDIPTAAEIAERLLASGHEEAMLLNLAAWRREEAGDYAGAHALLRRALALAPGDPLLAGAIGAVLRKEGRLDEALALLDRVVAAAPGHAAAWLERGYTLDALRRDGEAADSYRRALAIDPGLAPALGKLADGAARRGEKVAADNFAGRALALAPHEPAAIAARALLALEAGDGAAAEATLRPLLAAGVSGDDRTRTLTLLGDSLDKQGLVEAAWSAWSEAQASFRQVYARVLEPGPDRPSHRAFIDAIAAQVRATASGIAHYRDHGDIPRAARRHIFLLGYPRSGTTLVENVLASAPGIVALEERDTFAGIDEALLANDGTMPDLDRLDPAEVARLRADYWARVAALGADVSNGTFVDMNPFNGIKLPLIARLFPDARILLMRRDPRDILLSCFRINFTPGPAAWAFSDVEEAARHYDALMRLTELCRERLPLAVHEVRYDALVADFEATIRAVAAFVDVPWTDEFHRFDRTAQTRGVRTASATQVRRGLFDGRGQWRRYEAQLAPVIPILEPWVTRFGFDA